MNPCKCCSFCLQKFVFILLLLFLSFLIQTWQNKIHCTNHEMHTASKSNWKWKRHLGGLNLVSLKWAILSLAWDISTCMYSVSDFEAALWHYLANSLEKICFHILSGVTTISMIILRYQILVSKQKNNCNVFFFCWLFQLSFQKLEKVIQYI